MYLFHLLADVAVSSTTIAHEEVDNRPEAGCGWYEGYHSDKLKLLQTGHCKSPKIVD